MSFNKLEIALLDELTRLRKVFADRDMPEIGLTITCSGPTMHDTIKIRFTIDGDYKSRSVEGDTIEATMEEFFRRNDWRQRHDALLLPNITKDHTNEA